MSLKDLIAARIRQSGPVSMADYMADCLMHPAHGYYATRDPLGVAGDFITAPEISQMFGELIGLAIAQTWLDQGSPSPFSLAELGPGRGTLMADAMRAAARVPGFVDAARIVLVEASPVLRDAQAAALKDRHPVWAGRLSDLPDRPLFLIANEFFDALPVRQFERSENGWCERRIGLDGESLIFGLGTETENAALTHRLHDTRPGDVVELCAPAIAIAAETGHRIAQKGGAALIIDYGDWRSLGDTVQAVRGHQTSGILDNPGQADLTAHVDFEALALAAAEGGCAYSRLTPQGIFLERLGITQRAQALASANGGSSRSEVAAAHRRLTHPAEMGNLFKVLGLYPEGAAPPPGLNP